MPKALVGGRDRLPWVVSASRTLAAGGCAETVVVIGAGAVQVRELLREEPVTIVVASDWESGIGASLRSGLNAIGGRNVDAALIHLVDLPDVGTEIVRRVATHATPSVLARASYGGGVQGHPVLLGRNHWRAIAEECAGDSGARAYLARHSVEEVDCSDLATGLDVDDPSHRIVRPAH